MHFKSIPRLLGFLVSSTLSTKGRKTFFFLRQCLKLEKKLSALNSSFHYVTISNLTFIQEMWLIDVVEIILVFIKTG